MEVYDENDQLLPHEGKIRSKTDEAKGPCHDCDLYANLYQFEEHVRGGIVEIMVCLRCFVARRQEIIERIRNGEHADVAALIHRPRVQREAIPQNADALDVQLALWIAQAGLEE